MSKRSRRRHKPRREPRQPDAQSPAQDAATLTGRERAHKLIDEGRWRDAADALLALTPREHRDTIGAAWCLCNAGEFEQARGIAEIALAEFETAAGHYLRARALTRGARYDPQVTAEHKNAAVAALERAVTLPNCPPYAYAMLTDHLGWDDDDIARRVQVLRDGVRETDDSSLRFRLASVLFRRLHDADGALDVLTPLLREPAASGAVQWLAFEIYRDRGEVTAALEALDVLEPVSDADRATLRTIRAAVLMMDHRYVEARECLRSLISAQQGLARARALLLEAYLEMRVEGNDISARAQRIARLASDAHDSAMTEEDATDLRVADLHFEGGHFEMYVFDEIDETCKVLLASEPPYPLDPLTRGWLLYALVKEATETGVHVALGSRPYPSVIDEAVQLDPGQRWASTWASAYAGVGDVVKAAQYELLDEIRRLAQHQRGAETERTDGDAVGSGARERGVYFFLTEHALSEASLTQETRRALHEAVLVVLREHDDPVTVERVMFPFYQSHWRDVLVDGELFDDWDEALAALASDAWHETPTDLLFDRAYVANRRGRTEEAERTYREMLAREDSAPAMHNLSLILEGRGALDEAAALAARATALDPARELYSSNAARLAQRQAAGAAQPGGSRSRTERGTRAKRGSARDVIVRTPAPTQTERATDSDFLRTAPERWPTLDRYKRAILATLMVIDGFKNFSELATFAGVEERFVPGHWRKLVEMGMVLDHEDGYQLNPHIRPLIERERTHAVATRLIRADDSLALKPIFNSRREYEVYAVLLALFPNQLVFPNIGLQAVFQYDRMKALLDPDDFRYYLMAQADFCITSTTTYFPILCFELDSPWHDGESQQIRDARKDRIFQRGGVPLLRVRPHGQPTRDALRQAIIDAVGDAYEEMLAAHGRVPAQFQEIDLTPFAIPTLSSE